jgi:two-component system cell cycle sensor histidine kinase/response regulator CckA
VDIKRAIPKGDGKTRILLVEDEASVRNVIVRLLTKLGYSVEQAENAAEAFEYFDDGQSFDLVVTDIVMPGLSGIQMADKLKERFPSQRILFISGYTSKEFGATLDAPPEPFLAKPFTIESLADAVWEALEEEV